MYVIPREPRFTISNADYISAIRSRLYLQGRAVQLTHCVCQRFTDGPGHYTVDSLHALSCKVGGRTIARHNMVTEAVASGLRQCGTRVEVEQAGYDHKSRIRPDIFAVINNVPTFIDIGISNPSAVSNRSHIPLMAADRYAATKLKKYEELAMENYAVVMPFIIESNGAYGMHAKLVASDIGNFANNNSLAFAPADVMKDLLDAVAVATQRGNAMTVRSAQESAAHNNDRQSSSASVRAVNMSTVQQGIVSDASPVQSPISKPPINVQPVVNNDAPPHPRYMSHAGTVPVRQEEESEYDEQIDDALLRRYSASSVLCIVGNVDDNGVLSVELIAY